MIKLLNYLNLYIKHQKQDYFGKFDINNQVNVTLKVKLEQPIQKEHQHFVFPQLITRLLLIFLRYQSSLKSVKLSHFLENCIAQTTIPLYVFYLSITFLLIHISK